jgi:hypothetical protein
LLKLTTSEAQTAYSIRPGGTYLEGSITVSDAVVPRIVASAVANGTSRFTLMEEFAPELPTAVGKARLYKSAISNSLVQTFNAIYSPTAEPGNVWSADTTVANKPAYRVTHFVDSTTFPTVPVAGQRHQVKQVTNSAWTEADWNSSPLQLNIIPGNPTTATAPEANTLYSKSIVKVAWSGTTDGSTTNVYTSFGLNVSGVTLYSANRIQINFHTPMANTNYVVVATALVNALGGVHQSGHAFFSERSLGNVIIMFSGTGPYPFNSSQWGFDVIIMGEQ